jgi:Rho GTPase-activating protein 1
MVKSLIIIFIDLLHDVSLRSASNKMDALNLAIVICPNLVKGSNPARDVAMVGVPGTPAFFARPSSDDGNGDGNNPQGERPATLGMVVALCIRRYYEVFDEVVDRSETVPAWRALHNVPYLASSGPGSPEQPMYVLSNEGEEEEDLDDDKLPKGVSPPASCNPVSSSSVSSPKRHKSTLSSGSNSGINRSMQTLTGETNGSILTIGSNGYAPYPTYGKAKSMINIENTGAPGNESRTRRGSITIGSGRVSSGASVEAIDVTAEGFFSPPDDNASLEPDGKGGWRKK